MTKKSWIQLALLILIIGIGVGASIYNKKKLNTCKEESIGKIYNIDKRKSRGYFVQYTYKVNEIEYKSSEMIKSRGDLRRMLIGDSIAIFISCENPNVSQYKQIEK